VNVGIQHRRTRHALELLLLGVGFVVLGGHLVDEADFVGQVVLHPDIHQRGFSALGGRELQSSGRKQFMADVLRNHLRGVLHAGIVSWLQLWVDDHSRRREVSLEEVACHLKIFRLLKAIVTVAHLALCQLIELNQVGFHALGLALESLASRKEVGEEPLDVHDLTLLLTDLTIDLPLK